MFFQDCLSLFLHYNYTMAYLIIGIVSFLAAGLTLFSGFGLSTILMPVLAVFFPLNIAITLTAIVHFLNNLLKFLLFGKLADKHVILKFGLPGVIAAFLGAKLLIKLQHLHPLFSYDLFSHTFQIMPIKLVIAAVIFIFALLEIIPRFQKLAFDKKYLVGGGLLSGFFGGLSGHQGALRSAFLIKCGLSKETFIATGVVIACLVDLSRISVYSTGVLSEQLREHTSFVLVAILSAFAGTLVGNRLIKKVTLHNVQVIVSIMLFLIAFCLALGLI